MLPMPPTIEQEPTTGRQAVKRDFDNLDSLIQELSQPKEVIQNSQPTPPPNSGGEQASYSGSPYPGGGYENENADPDELPDEVAELSGKMIAGTVDTTLSTAMGLYAHTSEVEKYEANEKQMQKLSEAWTAVAKKQKIRMEDAPYFNLIALSAGVYIPKFQDAKNDRRFYEMDQRFKEMQKMINDAEARLKVVEKQNEVKK